MSARKAIALLAVLVVLTATGLVACALTPRSDAPTGVEPPEAHEATYVLSGFEFEYPFRPDNADPNAAPSPSFAGITYRSEWLGMAFPGEGECQVILRGRDGSVVGTWYFLITTLEPRASLGPTSVEVTGEPTQAKAWCNATAPTGRYEFSNVVIKDEPWTRQGPKIVATVNMPPGTTGTHKCSANVHLADGSQVRYPFTLTTDGDSRLDLLLPPELSNAVSASLSCNPMS